MLTIEENNAEVKRRWQNRRLTGVECPNCKEELQFVDNSIKVGQPPQKCVVCKNCGFKSFICVFMVKRG